MAIRPRDFCPFKRTPKQLSSAAGMRQGRRALKTNSKTWRAIRLWQLNDEPLCRICRLKGVTEAANEVDHIDGDATNNEGDNLQSLCKSCHSRKTARENGSFGRKRGGGSDL